MSWLIGVDVGGTFTDFYAFHRRSGTAQIFKRPSTPENPGQAIIDGLDELCGEHGIDLGDVGSVCHGTTVATNALIQRRGGSVALLTTEGFRDLLEIGRQTRPHMYDLQRDHPEPLVPRARRFEVSERVTAEGAVVQPLTDAAVKSALQVIESTEIDACAVCLLFSFVNASHEQRIGEALAKAMPGVYVSLSSAVQPEFREYERLSTTVLNAYLQPVMVRYLQHLSTELERSAPGALVRIYQSSGGLMSIERARAFPVRTILSGPAAGAVGAVHQARLAGRENVILLDMGGTSADVSLVRECTIDTRLDRDVAGFPVRLPMVDISTVGAGGGSIAWFDRDGLIKVGPLSAGAEPGPACYGRGGQQPTVTDANLALGRLSSEGLLGGRMALDERAARAVIQPLADQLGFSVERTAHGILGIVVANMVRAIRGVSIERGHDPRRFTLLAFGGAGPLHAWEVASSLGIREIIVPPAPGILCAQGLIVSDLKEDFVRTARIRMSQENVGQLRTIVDELATEAEAWFEAEGLPVDGRTLELVFYMRYVGQNFELAVDVSSVSRGGRPNLPNEARLTKLFYGAHERQYGFYNPDDPVEIVNVRLVGRGRAPDIRQKSSGRARRNPVPTGEREIHFEADRPVRTPVYDRASLAPGHRIEGPAVVEQLDTTTLVHSGGILTVDPALNIVIKVVS